MNEERPYVKPTYREVFGFDYSLELPLFLVRWYAAKRDRRKPPEASNDRDRVSAVHLAYAAWCVWRDYDPELGYAQFSLKRHEFECGLSRRTLRHLMSILVRDRVVEDVTGEVDQWKRGQLGSVARRYRPLPWATGAGSEEVLNERKSAGSE